MAGSVSVIREWEPANPVMCAKLIEYITEKMAEFHAPCLFCRFSREAYTVDTGQRDELVNEIKDLTARLPGKDKEINYAGTDDIMMAVRLPEKHKRSRQGPPRSPGRFLHAGKIPGKALAFSSRRAIIPDAARESAAEHIAGEGKS